MIFFQILDGFTYKDEVLSAEHLPGLLTLITVDCILARISGVLKTKLVMMTEALKVEFEKLFAVVLKLMKVYQGFARYESVCSISFNQSRSLNVNVHTTSTSKGHFGFCLHVKILRL